MTKNTVASLASQVTTASMTAVLTLFLVRALGVKEYDVPVRQPFPKSAESLLADLRLIVQVLPKQFPNLKLCYVSSRSYGGWALREGNREPFSYETGYAVKWLIEEQLRGDEALNFDPQKGEVKAPWLSWGSYLWANGDRPRKDGFVFAVPYINVVLFVIAAIVVGILAAVLPARWASRLNVLEALQYE